MAARFDAQQTSDVGVKLLGAPRPVATIVSESLVVYDLMGHDSHGSVRWLQDASWIKEGRIRPEGHASVVSGGGVIVAADGAGGFGQPAARLATATASQTAKDLGAAVVQLRPGGGALRRPPGVGPRNTPGDTRSGRGIGCKH